MAGSGAVEVPLEVVPGAPEVILGGALAALCEGLPVDVGGGGQVGPGEVLRPEHLRDDPAGQHILPGVADKGMAIHPEDVALIVPGPQAEGGVPPQLAHHGAHLLPECLT